MYIYIPRQRFQNVSRCSEKYHSITNYQIDVQQEVRANIICIDGLPVGGSICTVALDGFMHGLKKEIQK